MYVNYLRFLNEYFAENVLDKQDLICLHTIRWFHFIIFLYNSGSCNNIIILTFSKRSLKRFTLKKSLSCESENSIFDENVFNSARRLTWRTLWLFFLFQNERVSKFCVTNAQSGYNDLLSSWFSESWSPFFKSGLDLEEFIVDVIIPALLPFCEMEFVAPFDIVAGVLQVVTFGLYLYIISLDDVLRTSIDLL